jgi:hypothetical protein
MSMRLREILTLLAAGMVLAGFGFVGHVSAQSSSAHYKVEESVFGTGGELDASSPNYRAKQSAGETVVGNATSAHYQFQGGFNTTDQPLLEFAVNGGTYDLGVLDASATGSAAATFSIRNYLSSGYIVTLNGTAPGTTSGNPHALTPLSAQTGSSPGTEQFGVNLVANTNPAIGADPSQAPDSSFSFGSATNGYATANLYKFVPGDTVAFSSKSSGQTNYTMSIIANVERNTPAGQYGGSLNLQVIPTF